MVSTLLEKRGYNISTASDGEEGLMRADQLKPDLIITDVMMPKLDGWALVRALRSRPELALVPVIFLTALGGEEDRIRGFRLGADDYLPKPFRFEELDLRVARILRRTQGMVQEARDQLGNPGLKGDLAQVGLSALLTLIELERKTGMLTLKNTDHHAAQILVREGRVVHARLEDATEPVDVECVYALLQWSGGSFEFLACDVEGPDRVQTPTMHILMEGARLMDEANREQAS